jgi:hypothetical protein
MAHGSRDDGIIRAWFRWHGAVVMISARRRRNGLTTPNDLWAAARGYVAYVPAYGGKFQLRNAAYQQTCSAHLF